MMPKLPRCRAPRKAPLGLTLAALALTLLAAGPAQARHAKPSLTSDAWQLAFEYEKPQPIAITDADGNTHWFWYLPYSVTNQTDQRQLFVPQVTVASDTGRIVEANQDVPAKVYEKIFDRLENPLLKSPVEVTGPLLVGEDYAKESVFIWPAAESSVLKETDSLRIFIAGLSGETATVENPRTGEPIKVQRTLMLEYRLPGAPTTPERQPVTFAGEEWIMR
jgi:hypothetical protein